MAQIDSHRRLPFFQQRILPRRVSELIVSKRPVMDHPLEVGSHRSNLLCVGLVYQGVSIPLAYQSLSRATPIPTNVNTC